MLLNDLTGTISFTRYWFKIGEVHIQWQSHPGVSIPNRAKCEPRRDLSSPRVLIQVLLRADQSGLGVALERGVIAIENAHSHKRSPGQSRTLQAMEP